MDIEKIRERMEELIRRYNHHEAYCATKILSIEIVPERECKYCHGTGSENFYGPRNPDCRVCNGIGKLPPITVEQAIKKVME